MTTLVLVAMLAGKLADDAGFRGLKFGPDSVLTTAPMDGCVAAPEPGAAWACTSKIGESPVLISYIASRGLYEGVLIRAEGYTDCTAIKGVLTAAWGAPVQDNKYIEKYFWRDLPMAATFDYNEVSKKCSIYMFNLDVAKQRKAVEEEAAKKAVDDL